MKQTPRRTNSCQGAQTPRQRELNTKRRGELAEIAFAHKAIAQGFPVAKPFGDSERYDFVLDGGQALWRIQVKSSTHNVDDPEMDDTEYKVHYMITSRLFRQHYFSGIEVGGGTLKGSELGQTGGWSKSSSIIRQEMSVERGKGGEPWHFETEVFTNGYKVFQFLLPPKDAVRKWAGASV